MKFYKISLKWQFIIVMAFVAMPFIALLTYHISEEKKQETKDAKGIAISLAHNISIQQKNAEAYTRQMLSLISKLPELQEDKPDSSKLSQIFRNVLSENPQFAIVLSALPNGKAHAAAIPFSPFSIADRKYYKDVIRTRSFAIGEFAKSRLTNKAVLHYALPVLNSKGEIKIILIASFDLIQYQNLLSVSTLPQGSDFAFYDYSGRMLYHSRSHQKFLGKRGSPEIQGAINAKTDEGSYFSESGNGEKRLIAFVRIHIEKDSPYMYIVISSPEPQAFKDSDLFFSKDIIFLGIAILLSLVISFCFRNFIFKNIDKLVSFANKLREGDLSSKSDLDYTSKEIGSIAQSLDSLAESLNTREVERDAAIKNLKIVTERLEVAVSSARIGIWEWNLHTHKLFWDSQMFELYHTNPSDFTFTIADWMKKLHHEDSLRFEEELHHSIRHKKQHKTTFRVKNGYKGFKNVRCYFNVISDANGKAHRLTGVNWDISERVLLEHELTRSKEKSEELATKLKIQIEAHLYSLKEKISTIYQKTEKVQGLNLDTELNDLQNLISECREDITVELNKIQESK